MGKPVVHFDIGCTDKKRTQQFYAQLFDWNTDPYGSHALKIDTGSPQGIQGFITSLGHEPHHYVMFYVEVDDIAAHLKKAQALGGRALMPQMAIPGGGHFAWLADPDGNIVGLLKKAT